MFVNAVTERALHKGAGRFFAFWAGFSGSCTLARTQKNQWLRKKIHLRFKATVLNVFLSCVRRSQNRRAVAARVEEALNLKRKGGASGRAFRAWVHKRHSNQRAAILMGSRHFRAVVKLAVKEWRLVVQDGISETGRIFLTVFTEHQIASQRRALVAWALAAARSANQMRDARAQSLKNPFKSTRWY